MNFQNFLGNNRQMQKSFIFKSFFTYLSFIWNRRFNQSHYKEVPRWEIFMEQELRFGLDLGRLAVLKKRVWATVSDPVANSHLCMLLGRINSWPYKKSKISEKINTLSYTKASKLTWFEAVNDQENTNQE